MTWPRLISHRCDYGRAESSFVFTQSLFDVENEGTWFIFFPWIILHRICHVLRNSHSGDLERMQRSKYLFIPQS